MQIKQDNDLYILGNELEEIKGTYSTVYVSEGMLNMYKAEYPDLTFKANNWECWHVSLAPYEPISNDPIDKPTIQNPDLYMTAVLADGLTELYNPYNGETYLGQNYPGLGYIINNFPIDKEEETTLPNFLADFEDVFNSVRLFSGNNTQWTNIDQNIQPKESLELLNLSDLDFSDLEECFNGENMTDTVEIDLPYNTFDNKETITEEDYIGMLPFDSEFKLSLGFRLFDIIMKSYYSGIAGKVICNDPDKPVIEDPDLYIKYAILAADVEYVYNPFNGDVYIPKYHDPLDSNYMYLNNIPIKVDTENPTKIPNFLLAFGDVFRTLRIDSNNNTPWTECFLTPKASLIKLYLWPLDFSELTFNNLDFFGQSTNINTLWLPYNAYKQFMKEESNLILYSNKPLNSMRQINNVDCDVRCGYKLYNLMLQYPTIWYKLNWFTDEESALKTQLNYSDEYIQMLEDAGMDVYDLDEDAVALAEQYTGTNINDIDSATLKSFKYMPKFSNLYLSVGQSMFKECLAETMDLSNFDTSNVTSMFNMFGYCNSLQSLDLSNLDTSNVTNMNSIFRGCSSLVSLNVSNFDTSNVTSMFNMFYDCHLLNYIRCKQAFKDWCIENQDTISLPEAMREGGSGTWDIVD